MKIIQIMSGTESGELIVFGLGDDGILYMLKNETIFNNITEEGFEEELAKLKWLKVI